MRVARAFIHRDFLIATSYRAPFAMQVLSIFIAVPLYYFVGRQFGSLGSDFLVDYQGNYFAFLLIGMAFLDYLVVSLRTFSDRIRDSQLTGTLEIILLSPTTLNRMLIYSSLWVYVFTTTRFILYLLLGLLFGLDLHDANVPAAVAILMLSVVSFASVGIMSASVIMVLKQGEIIHTFLSVVSMFLGGVLFQNAVMPQWLQALSKLLPITHGLQGLRLALLKGVSTAELLPQFAVLALFATVLVPLALLSFWAAVRWTKVTGTLAQY